MTKKSTQKSKYLENICGNFGLFAVLLYFNMNVHSSEPRFLKGQGK